MHITGNALSTMLLQDWCGQHCTNSSRTLSNAHLRTYLVVSLITEQGMNKQICNVLPMYSPTDAGIFCENAPSSGWLSFEAARSDDGKLHVATYTLQPTDHS